MAVPNEGGVELRDLSAVINHVVLPPQLPQQEDGDQYSVEDDLVHLTDDVAQRMLPSLPLEHHPSWQSVLKMLYKLKSVKHGTGLRSDVLEAHLTSMKPSGTFTQALELSALTWLRLPSDSFASAERWPPYLPRWAGPTRV